MKRVLLILQVSVLFVSGWGVVVAHAFCPHMQARVQPKAQSVVTHSQGPSCHEEMAMESAQTLDVPAQGDGQWPSLEGHTGPCSHCFGRPDNPANLFVFARGAEPGSRNAGTPVLQQSSFLLPLAASFTPQVQARQHAPPGERLLRHLLFSALLI